MKGGEDVEEIMLMTAQIKVIGVLLNEMDAGLNEELSGWLDRYYDDLDRVRCELLEKELKKRMINNQEIWDEFREG
ncbi:hypothetical protein IGI39_004931 [Enterococcus sp. AZ135]